MTYIPRNAESRLKHFATGYPVLVVKGPRQPGKSTLDEAQRCPALFSYLQTRVDERQQPGEFILTGSQRFGLLSGITQSLAGRAALLTLLPMTYDELQRAEKVGRNLDKILFDGAFPPSSTADLNHIPGMETMCALTWNETSGN